MEYDQLTRSEQERLLIYYQTRVELISGSITYALAIATFGLAFAALPNSMVPECFRTSIAFIALIAAWVVLFYIRKSGNKEITFLENFIKIKDILEKAKESKLEALQTQSAKIETRKITKYPRSIWIAIGVATAAMISAIVSSRVDDVFAMAFLGIGYTAAFTAISILLNAEMEKRICDKIDEIRLAKKSRS